MSILYATTPYRPAPGGLTGWLASALFAAAPALAAICRRVWPIPGRGKFRAVTRYDDVVEVFGDDGAFGVTYHDNLQVITGGEPFFLGMSDTPAYRAQLAAARTVVLAADLPRLGDDAERRAAAIVAAAGGRLEVVEFIRRVAFDLYADYFGVPDPAPGRLTIWGSRLFEYQFTGSPSDTAWLADVTATATALRAHIDATIAARKTAPAGPDDVLGRCLAAQVAGQLGYADAEIRTMLMCMIVGGPPQPATVVPQGIEQLLRRPAWLTAASTAARSGDDARLYDILFEAMRFDPLAPGLKRTVLTDHVIARGTARATKVPAGGTVIAAFASAMMDPRRVPDPARFDPDRLPRDYLHFGHGLHECFGRQFNHATLHRMIKPLLARGPVRAAGPQGSLRKNGMFADRLVVTFS